MNKKYYVYGLFDESDVIFYIGKGTNKRYKNHRKNYKIGKVTNYFLYCKIKSIFNKGFDFTEKIIINDHIRMSRHIRMNQDIQGVTITITFNMRYS